MRFFRQKHLCTLALAASLVPFLVALAMQHWFGMQPCVLCIYQRVALLGMAASALLVFYAKRCRFLRVVGLLLWLYSATRGLVVAWEQAQRHLHPLRFHSCDFRVRFPSWLSLDEWQPWLFQAKAGCDAVDWSFGKLNIPQLMVVLFAVHVLLSAWILVSQYREWRWYAEH